jgi:hypothetical protein
MANLYNFQVTGPITAYATSSALPVATMGSRIDKKKERSPPTPSRWASRMHRLPWAHRRWRPWTCVRGGSSRRYFTTGRCGYSVLRGHARITRLRCFSICFTAASICFGETPLTFCVGIDESSFLSRRAAVVRLVCSLATRRTMRAIAHRDRTLSVPARAIADRRRGYGQGTP